MASGSGSAQTARRHASVDQRLRYLNVAGTGLKRSQPDQLAASKAGAIQSRQPFRTLPNHGDQHRHDTDQWNAIGIYRYVPLAAELAPVSRIRPPLFAPPGARNAGAVDADTAPVEHTSAEAACAGRSAGLAQPGRAQEWLAHDPAAAAASRCPRFCCPARTPLPCFVDGVGQSSRGNEWFRADSIDSGQAFIQEFASASIAAIRVSLSGNESLCVAPR